MRRKYSIAAIIALVLVLTVTLTSGTSSDIRDGGGKDPVDELYDQAIKQNEKLEAVEDGISRFYKKKSEAVDKFNSFVYYNERYYSDARSKASAITDAATKQKAMDIISKSESAYRTKIATWQTDIAALNARERNLNELRTLLKIKVTEPMIARYQDAEMPGNAKLKEAAADLESLIGQINGLIQN